MCVKCSILVITTRKNEVIKNEKGLLILLTVATLSTPCTVFADTVDTLHDRIETQEQKCEDLFDTLCDKDDSLDTAKTKYNKVKKQYKKVKKHAKHNSKKFKKARAKFLKAKKALNKAKKSYKAYSKKYDMAYSKAEKYQESYDDFMHDYVLHHSDDKRAFSYAYNNTELFSNNEWLLVLSNFQVYVCNDLNVNVMMTTSGDFDNTVFGYYNHATNTLAINMNNNKDCEGFDTVAHECRHAWQYTQEEFTDNLNNYITAEQDYQGYYTQLVETDARYYAEDICTDLDCMNY